MNFSNKTPTHKKQKKEFSFMHTSPENLYEKVKSFEYEFGYDEVICAYITKGREALKANNKYKGYIYLQHVYSRLLTDAKIALEVPVYDYTKNYGKKYSKKKLEKLKKEKNPKYISSYTNKELTHHAYFGEKTDCPKPSPNNKTYHVGTYCNIRNQISFHRTTNKTKKEKFKLL